MLENASEFIEANSYCHQEGAESFLKLSSYYHRLTRLGRPRLRNVFTRVIKITSQSGTGNVIHNPCDARNLHARLLSVLARMTRPPAVIVLDYTYTTDYCKPEMPESKALRKALIATTPRIPTVLGLSDLSWPELVQEGQEKSLPRQLNPAEAVLDPLQWYPVPGSDRLRYGLVRLHCDVERIPLTWSTYQDRTLTTAEHLPTITEAASTLFDAKAISDELATRTRNGQDALITLLPDIKSYDAREVIAGQQAVLEDLANHIVIICDFEDDMIDSPSGLMPGGLFHANYIESVLTDTYSWTAPQIFVVLASFLWFMAIELLFDRYAHSPFVAALLSLLASAVFLLVLFWIIVKLFGYYIVAWPPSTVFLVGKIWFAVQARYFTERAPAAQK